MSNAETNYSLKELVIYFLKLGTTGFGGPVALVGYMHRDLVENRKMRRYICIRFRCLAIILRHKKPALFPTPHPIAIGSCVRLTIT